MLDFGNVENKKRVEWKGGNAKMQPQFNWLAKGAPESVTAEGLKIWPDDRGQVS